MGTQIMVIEFAQLEITSRNQLRQWLHRHHATSKGIWLVTFKKGKGAHVGYDDIVEEALCFGWIDSQPRTLDNQRSQRLLTPRKASSSWSRLNKQRIEKLIAAGHMTPAGQAAIEAAQRNGAWHALDEVEDLIEPDDLRQALDALSVARTQWNAFPRSSRRAILEWIGAAKTAATRDRRVELTVSEAAQGRRANQWRQPNNPPHTSSGS